MSNSLRPHGLQHARPPCPSPPPGVYSTSCPSSRWCHPAISSSVVPFSCLQSFTASRSFPWSQFVASGGQSIGVSVLASVLPMNTQDWSLLEWTGCFFTYGIGQWIINTYSEWSHITVWLLKYFNLYCYITLWSKHYIIFKAKAFLSIFH